VFWEFEFFPKYFPAVYEIENVGNAVV